MKILIFGGTTEGRVLSRQLAGLGASVTVSVATEYGAETQGQCPGVRVLCGRLETVQMVAMLPEYAACIDATHPYAVKASENIRAACAQSGTEYRRLLRPAEEENGAETAASAADAARMLAAREGRVLLTTGAKELEEFAFLGGERLVARVLPSTAGLAACEQAGIPHKNIIAMQGPFSLEMNRATLRQYKIRWMVTKNGGGPGGFAEKLQAAKACGVGLIVIERPEENGYTQQQILEWVQKKLEEQA